MKITKLKLFLMTIGLGIISQTQINAQTIDATGTTNQFFEINKNGGSTTSFMRIRSATTSPYWNFINTNGAFKINNNLTDNIFNILSDGKIGIGTIAPASKLDISDGDIRFTMPNGAGRKGSKIEWYENAYGNEKIELTYVGQNLSLPFRGLDRLVFANGAWDWNSISESANTNQEHTNVIMAMEPGSKAVGIGTLNPKWRLDVTGAINATEYRLNGEVVSFGGGGGTSPWTLSGSDINYLGGNVGVGIANPERKLHMRGDVLRIDRDHQTSGVIIARFNSGYSSVNKSFLIGVDGDDGIEGEFSIADYGNGLDLTGAGNKRFIIQNDGNVEIVKSLSVGSPNIIPGTVAHFDGRVYISENDGTEQGFTSLVDSNYTDYLLWVEEGIVSKDFAIANTTDWPDYVFHKDYKLPSLTTIEQSIKENGHLPTMPSAKEIEDNGFTVTDMTKRMVKTIEELTLHTIDQKKQIDNQNKLVAELMQRLEILEKK
ncbi:hypothetical protein [Pedobacter glucosidilyticus]|uniref:hypothetical protein n=1 Tax=Pedobacter glucosidilyticus TaxID=1122941 RepID=UPI00068637CA|nr:hypothetical protein [Pedobacter glucosidilyticus]